MFRTSNPTLNSKTFGQGISVPGTGAMTIQGTVNKTIILLCLAVLSGAFVWKKFYAVGPQAGYPMAQMWMIGGAIGGFIASLVCIFKKNLSPVVAPIYALLEGLFLGGISCMLELQFPGIVMQAVGLTFGTMFSLLVAYKSGLIKVTEKFRLGVAAAMGGIMLFYVAMMLLSFFGIRPGFFYGNSPVSILISGVVVVVAALNLVLDFDSIERASKAGLPSYMEWYGAFGLMVSLVWLYIEILRLLSKLRSRD